MLLRSIVVKPERIAEIYWISWSCMTIQWILWRAYFGRQNRAVINDYSYERWSELSVRL